VLNRNQNRTKATHIFIDYSKIEVMHGRSQRILLGGFAYNLCLFNSKKVIWGNPPTKLDYNFHYILLLLPGLLLLLLLLLLLFILLLFLLILPLFY